MLAESRHAAKKQFDRLDARNAWKLRDAAFRKREGGHNYTFDVTQKDKVITGRFVTVVRFKADFNGLEGSIIQSVKQTQTLVPKMGKANSVTNSFVEGWAVDNEGKAKVLDIHSLVLPLDTSRYKSMTVKFEMAIVAGKYKNELITGRRGEVEESIPGYYDAFKVANNDPALINPIGPWTKYTIEATVYDDGRWEFKDGSIGLDISGKFDMVDKKK